MLSSKSEKKKYCNPTFIVEDFSSLVLLLKLRKVFHCKNSMCHYSICYIFYYLLIASASAHLVSTLKREN